MKVISRQVRRVNEWDSPAMLKIYEHYISSGHATSATQVPTLAETVTLVDQYTYGKGWVLSEAGGLLLGFALLTENADYPEDRFSADVHIYVHPDYLGRGVGRSLYTLLLGIAAHSNLRRITARVALPNTQAVSFHEKQGFVPVRTDHAAFEKRGESHDLLIMEKILTPDDPDAQRPTKPFLIVTDDYEALRREAARHIESIIPEELDN